MCGNKFTTITTFIRIFKSKEFGISNNISIYIVECLQNILGPIVFHPFTNLSIWSNDTILKNGFLTSQKGYIDLILFGKN